MPSEPAEAFARLRRLHPISPVFTIATEARALLLPGLLLLIASRSGDLDVWVMLLFLPSMTLALVKYATFRYLLAEDELVIRSGILGRNERHIPYARIQNIGLRQNILHRLMGVAEVQVETAGGTEPEARLKVLALEVADEMRRRVFAVKRVQGVGAEPTQTSAGSAPKILARLPLSEVALFGMLNSRGLVVALTLLGIVWEMGRFGSGWPLLETTPRELATMLFRGGLLSARRAAILVVVLVAGAILLRFLSAGWALLKLYDFQLARAGDDLGVSCGLLTRTTATIPRHRIQLLSIVEPFLQRSFGRAQVKVETAGGGEEASLARQWLVPSVTRESLGGLIAEVQPEVEVAGAAWEMVDPRAHRRIFKRMVFLALGVTITFMWMFGVLAALVLPFLLAGAFLDARLEASRMGWSLTPTAILFRRGWWEKHVSIVRYAKVQAVTLAESPFDRRWGMATVKIDTAGARGGGREITIPYLRSDIARRLLDDVEQRAARTTFRW